MNQSLPLDFPQIEQAKQEWETTVDALPQLVCVLDEQRRILRANRTVERWGLGQVTQIKGQDFIQLLYSQRSDMADYLVELFQQAWHGLAQGEAAEYEIEDNTLGRYLRLQLLPILSHSQFKSDVVTSFAAIICHDVTERKQLEAALHRANEQLEQRVQERTAALMKANIGLLEEIVERERADEALRESEARYRQLAAELQALYETSLRLNTQLELTDLLYLIAEQVVSLLKADAGGLYLYDVSNDQLRLEVAVGNFNDKIGATYKLGQTFVGRVFESRPPDFIPTPSSGLTAYTGLAHLETVLAVPLLGSEGIVGILGIGSAEAEYFDEHAQWLAEMFATQAVIALENARLHAETQQHAKQLAAINAASYAVLSALDLETVLGQILAEIQHLLMAEDVSILLHNPLNDTLTFAAVANVRSQNLVNTSLPSDKSIASWVFQQQEPILSNDVSHDERFYSGVDQITGMTTKSLLAVPLIVKNNAIGVVEVFNKTIGQFEPTDLELLKALASAAAIAIDNARLYEAEREQFRRLQESQASIIQIEKMAALGRLIGSIAHEINNPLQSVQGFMGLLKEELDGRKRAEKINKYLDIADSEIERISDMVRRMRDFYRPTTTQMPATTTDSLDQFYRPNPTELEVVQLDEILDNVLHLTHKKIQQHKVTLERRWANNLPAIRGHTNHLKQVFLNLILNALDAMPPKGGKLLIMVKPETGQLHGSSPHPTLRIDFSDTGAGIPSHVLPRIFEPLFTTKEHGSGFGLFTSYKIIEAHCGDIRVTSEVGLGTTFTIILPINQPI